MIMLVLLCVAFAVSSGLELAHWPLDGHRQDVSGNHRHWPAATLNEDERVRPVTYEFQKRKGKKGLYLSPSNPGMAHDFLGIASADATIAGFVYRDTADHRIPFAWMLPYGSQKGNGNSARNGLGFKYKDDAQDSVRLLTHKFAVPTGSPTQPGWYPGFPVGAPSAEWIHFAVTWDGESNERSFYWGGQLLKKDTLSSNLWDSGLSQTISLGKDLQDSRASHGAVLLRDVRIFDEALSSQKISDLVLNGACQCNVVTEICEAGQCVSNALQRTLHPDDGTVVELEIGESKVLMGDYLPITDDIDVFLPKNEAPGATICFDKECLSVPGQRKTIAVTPDTMVKTKVPSFFACMTSNAADPTMDVEISYSGTTYAVTVAIPVQKKSCFNGIMPFAAELKTTVHKAYVTNHENDGDQSDRDTVSGPYDDFDECEEGCRGSAYWCATSTANPAIWCYRHYDSDCISADQVVCDGKLAGHLQVGDKCGESVVLANFDYGPGSVVEITCDSMQTLRASKNHVILEGGKVFADVQVGDVLGDCTVVNTTISFSNSLREVLTSDCVVQTAVGVPDLSCAAHSHTSGVVGAALAHTAYQLLPRETYIRMSYFLGPVIRSVWTPIAAGWAEFCTGVLLMLVSGVTWLMFWARRSC